jgi:hypothetical protein
MCATARFAAFQFVLTIEARSLITRLARLKTGHVFASLVLGENARHFPNVCFVKTQSSDKQARTLH